MPKVECDLQARWKAAEAEDSKQAYQEGFAAPTGWVEDVGKPNGCRPREVNALRRVVKEGLKDKLNVWIKDQGIAHGLYHAIFGEESDRGDAAKIEEWDFARGFVEGAIDLADKIEAA